MYGKAPRDAYRAISVSGVSCCLWSYPSSVPSSCHVLSLTQVNKGVWPARLSSATCSRKDVLPCGTYLSSEGGGGVGGGGVSDTLPRPHRAQTRHTPPPRLCTRRIHEICIQVFLAAHNAGSGAWPGGRGSGAAGHEWPPHLHTTAGLCLHHVTRADGGCTHMHVVAGGRGAPHTSTSSYQMVRSHGINTI